MPFQALLARERPSSASTELVLCSEVVWGVIEVGAVEAHSWLVGVVVEEGVPERLCLWGSF